MKGGHIQEESISDFEAWQALVRPHGNWLDVHRDDSEAFIGTFRPQRISGLNTFVVGCNVRSLDRTLRHTRRDDMDHYLLHFKASGRSKCTLVQNDRAIEISAGGWAFIDMSQPYSFITGNAFGQCVPLRLPRRTVISHLGREPKGNVGWGSDALAARLLTRLVLDSAEECDTPIASTEHYMQLAVYDLLGALLASSDLLTYSSHNEKMFRRVSNIVKSNFTDPGLRPQDVATEAGISLRYLQKLFTARGTTCSSFIQSLRLDHAARLVRLRNGTKSGQPLIDIAYASGFQDYGHFTRSFRRRFGHSPGTAADYMIQ
jgi:AraC family transcriptional regulator, positive regulator of tynA and feaB